MERGLNKSGKLSEISSHLLDLQSDVIVLIETRVKIAKAKTVRENLKLKGNFIYNYSGHDNGRIWVEWDNANVDIKLVRSTNQMIHYGVYDLSGNFKHWMTYIYIPLTILSKGRRFGKTLRMYMVNIRVLGALLVISIMGSRPRIV